MLWKRLIRLLVTVMGFIRRERQDTDLRKILKTKPRCPACGASDRVHMRGDLVFGYRCECGTEFLAFEWKGQCITQHFNGDNEQLTFERELQSTGVSPSDNYERCGCDNGRALTSYGRAGHPSIVVTVDGCYFSAANVHASMEQIAEVRAAMERDGVRSPEPRACACGWGPTS